MAGGRCRGWPAVTSASWLRGQEDTAWANPGRASLCRFESAQPSAKLRGHKGWEGRCGAIPFLLLLLPPGIPRGCPVSQPGRGHKGVRLSRRDVRLSPRLSLVRIPGPAPPPRSLLSAPLHNPTGQEQGARKTSDIRGPFGKGARSGLPPSTPTLPHPWGGGAAPQTQRGSLPWVAFPSFAAKPAVRACCEHKLL